MKESSYLEGLSALSLTCSGAELYMRIGLHLGRNLNNCLHDVA